MRLPGKDSLDLVFKRAASAYHHEDFLEVFKEMVKNLKKIFESQSCELTIFDQRVMNLMADISPQNAKKVTEVLIDKSLALLIRSNTQGSISQQRRAIIYSSLLDQQAKTPKAISPRMMLPQTDLGKLQCIQLISTERMTLQVDKRVIFRNGYLVVPILKTMETKTGVIGSFVPNKGALIFQNIFYNTKLG